MVAFMLPYSSPSYALPETKLGDETLHPEAKDLETLLTEAREFFAADRPIDARSKLQKALKKAPEDFRPHMMLGTYYLAKVGHFRLAYKYLRTAELLFEKNFGSDLTDNLSKDKWQEHARLLYLLAESRLNLDDYQGAHDILQRFGKRYWDPGYPGTLAWVLMKLKRVDEAIRVSQAGLLRGAEPGRTYNILGILLSLKDNSDLSLRAFAKSIQSERALGGNGQIATPLNNSGEVYRERFQDDFAEASWIKALQLPDGCDHILPSLNLAILYTDELRFFQANRVLDDFEACFAAKSLRTDTEHRSLLALARGRIALHQGDIEKAVALLNMASERQQWFGKIGTNENDLRFAATIALARALEGQRATLKDRRETSLLKRIQNQALIPWLQARSWWLYRRAREIAIDELSDMEDLHIRHTDAMLEYPTLGAALRGFSIKALTRRIQRMLTKDTRKGAWNYYKLYLAQNLLANGEEDKALSILRQVKTQLRDIDRLLRAELLATTIQALMQKNGIFFRLQEEEKEELGRNKEELFQLHPSYLRFYDFALPVEIQKKSLTKHLKSFVDGLANHLESSRFQKSPASSTQFLLTIGAKESKQKTIELFVHLIDKNSQKTIAREKILIGPEDKKGNKIRELNNRFIELVFHHRVDSPSTPLPRLTLLEGILNGRDRTSNSSP